MNTEQNLLDNDLVIDTESAGHLKEASVWGKFLGIMGFVYSGVIAISGILTGIALSGMWGNYGRRGPRLMEAGIASLVYLLGATIVFFMSLHLFRFSRKIQVAIISNDQLALPDSLRNLKLYFRFAGIISIITLVLTVFAIVGVMLAASFSRY